MELPFVTGEAGEARRAYLEYRAAFKVSRQAADELAARSYRALSQGKRLLSVAEAVRAAGIDERGRPRLAISRADQEWCYLRQSQSEVGFGPWRTPPRSRANRSLWFTYGLESPGLPFSWMQSHGLRSHVPMVPPALRPPSALEGYHVLWEPVWEVDPVPPRDPALLKRLAPGVDVWAVLAVWDMTEVERMVLGLVRS